MEKKRLGIIKEEGQILRALQEHIVILIAGDTWAETEMGSEKMAMDEVVEIGMAGGAGMVVESVVLEVHGGNEIQDRRGYGREDGDHDRGPPREEGGWRRDDREGWRGRESDRKRTRRRV